MLGAYEFGCVLLDNREVFLDTAVSNRVDEWSPGSCYWRAASANEFSG